MKKTMIFGMLTMTLATLATPSVVITDVSRDAASGLVRVKYTLADGPAIVTARFYDGGEAIPGSNVVSIAGDINRSVSKTSGEFAWNIQADFPNRQFTANALSVQLKAWQQDSPPDLMVADLRSMNCVRYYESAADVPGGLGKGGADENRIRKMVMRRIHAKGVESQMGSPTTENCHQANEVLHYVTLASDYYFGVYPLTEGQYLSVTNGVNSSRLDVEGFDDALLCPMAGLTYSYVRGAKANGIDWPNTDESVISGTSFLQKIRNRTGIAFDLPTEAQWEIAARAGTTGALNDGTENITNNANDDNADKLGWTRRNAQKRYGNAISTSGPVGYFTPNAWDIYDIHGELYEVCRDWYQADLTNPAVDPEKGPASGEYRVARAGIFKYNVEHCRSAKRTSASESSSSDTNGYRLYAPCSSGSTAPTTSETVSLATAIPLVGDMESGTYADAYEAMLFVIGESGATIPLNSDDEGGFAISIR